MRFVVLAALCSGCVIPFATPPLKGEIGGTTSRYDDATHAEQMVERSALHAAVGAHLASATLTDRPLFDIGAGWTMDSTKSATSHGMYVDVSMFIDRYRFSRTSVGARIEKLWIGDRPSTGAKLRIDTELFKTGQGAFDSDDKCGNVSGSRYGTTAIGAFVEAGRSWADQMSGGDAWVATAGVTLRLPTTAGVWIGIPGC